MVIFFFLLLLPLLFLDIVCAALAPRGFVLRDELTGGGGEANVGYLRNDHSMHSTGILFFGYANETAAPLGAIREFSAVDFYICEKDRRTSAR